MSDDLVSHMDMLDNAGQMLFDDFPNSMTETCIWAAAHIRALEAQLAQRDAALKAADDLADAAKAVDAFVGYSADVPSLRENLNAAISAFLKARGQDANAKG